MTTVSSVKIEGFENRGTPEYPFGWVYFNDGSRVGFGVADGETKMWGSDGGYWSTAGPRHVKAAKAYLIEEGVLTS